MTAPARVRLPQTGRVADSFVLLCYSLQDLRDSLVSDSGCTSWCAESAFVTGRYAQGLCWSTVQCDRGVPSDF